MNTSVRWKSLDIGQHAGIKAHSRRQLVTSHDDGTQIPKDLAPGESVRLSRRAAYEDVRNTSDDNLLFQNGGAVRDRDNEGGLTVTEPSGKQYQVPGYIDYNSKGQPSVYFRTEHDGDWETWEQTFPQEGGATLTRVSGESEYDSASLSATLKPDGTVEANERDYSESAEVSFAHSSVGFETEMEARAIRPAVPMEWFLA